jgi:hypothetical protein
MPIEVKMNPDLAQLIELQKIDSEIFRLESLLKKIPEEIEQLKKKKEELLLKYETLENEIKHLQVLKREKELDIQTQEDRIQNIQNALERVRTNEEYKALLREKAQIEENIMEIEDEILKIMEDLEQLESEKKEIENQVSTEKIKIEQEIQEKEKEIEEIKKELSNLKEKYEDLKKNIKPQLLSRYELVKKKTGEKVVVPIEDSTCTGCYMVIPPKVYSQIIKEEKLLNCPHCGRFLHYEPV